MAHYSNGTMKCACCGESITEFLAIDHIEGGGNKERKRVGSGQPFFRWLEQNGYPLGYQVLCHNCNMARAFYGACPHTKQVHQTA